MGKCSWCGKQWTNRNAHRCYQGVNLYRAGDRDEYEHSYTDVQWERMLKLARAHGWQPARELTDEKRGPYWGEGDGIVEAADAHAFAAALERALLPELAEGRSPVGTLGGVRRATVEKVAAYCRDKGNGKGMFDVSSGRWVP